MSSDFLVSIVIPTYNCEEYVRDCLVSTLNQTYSNIEIIIVDDNSTDSTVAICEEYARRDGRIKIVKNNGKKGVSSARNAGIRIASGEYIVFFDADDCPDSVIIEEYLKAVELWREKNVSIILCGMYYDNNLKRYVASKISILESGLGYIEGERYLLKRNYAATLAWLKIFNFVTNKIYEVKRIKEHGLLFDERINIGEDLKFNLDYLETDFGYIGMINKPLYHYIKRTGESLSLTYHENDIEDTKAIYRRFVEWETIQKGVTNENILVVKSIFIADWISRLTTMHDYCKQNKCLTRVIKIKLDSEISNDEFRGMLKEIYYAGKISTVRYLALKTGKLDVFCWLRRRYQFLKGRPSDTNE